MPTLTCFRTTDSSKKITTYLLKDASGNCFFDFGSNDVSSFDIKRTKYIFITHEHMDHFMGLLNPEYVEILLNNNCEIYASNVTKDLINALFEYVYRINYDEKTIRKIRRLLNGIKGLLFFGKYQISNDIYIKLFPSGHTFGSSCIYVHSKNVNILYTGDMDYDQYDNDRQYQIELEENEKPDYVIADGTYLNNESIKDESLKDIRDKILFRGFNRFLCKIEKVVFFSKKLMSIPKLKDKYCVVLNSEMKWYLKILQKYHYDPFVLDKIILHLHRFYDPENRIPLYVTYKKEEKQTNVTGLVGLHISFLDFSYFLQQFDCGRTKVLVGHYNGGSEKDIQRTFSNNDLTSSYETSILKEGEIEL